MKRRMWLQVGVVTVVLMAASFLDRPTLDKFVKALTAVGTAILGGAGRMAQAALDAGVPRIALAAGGALVAVALLAIPIARLVRRRRRADRHRAPWRQVLSLAKGGRAVSTIARETRMSQDAVRILLAPIPVDRTFEPGTSFRAEAADGGITPARRPKRPE